MRRLRSLLKMPVDFFLSRCYNGKFTARTSERAAPHNDCYFIRNKKPGAIITPGCIKRDQSLEVANIVNVLYQIICYETAGIPVVHLH